MQDKLYDMAVTALVEKTAQPEFVKLIQRYRTILEVMVTLGCEKDTATANRAVINLALSRGKVAIDEDLPTLMLPKPKLKLLQGAN